MKSHSSPSRSRTLIAFAWAACAILSSGSRGAAQPVASNGIHGTLPSELLFVPTGNEQINIYSLHRPNKLGPLAHITAGLVATQYQETVDSAGDLFVVNDSFTNPNTEYVTEYAPPYDGSPKILKGVIDPVGVAVDAAGTVYVSNCGAYCSDKPTIFVYKNGSTTPTSTITSPAFSSIGYLTFDKMGDLLIPNTNRATGASDVLVIRAGSSVPTRLHLQGLFNIGGPGVGSVAIDAAGNLFVENDSNANYILEFAPGARVASGIIDPFRFFDTPGSMSVGPNGDLYVPINCVDQSCEGSVLDFQPGAKAPSVVIGPAGPGIIGAATLPNANFAQRFEATDFDVASAGSTTRPISNPRSLPRPFGQRTFGARHAPSRGGGWLSPEAQAGTNLLYVAALGTPDAVAIYPAQGQGKTPIGLITSGVSAPQGIATDASGNLYVANSGNNTVTVYPPGQTNPSSTYTNGVGTPYDVKVGSDGKVYVANIFGLQNGDGSVTEYPAGSGTPSLTLSQPGLNAIAVALDSANNLYVSWYSLATGVASVFEYAPGSSNGKNLNLDLPAGSFPLYGMAFDHSGRLAVWYESLDHSIAYLAAFAPGATEPAIKLKGGSLLSNVAGIAFPRSPSEIYLGVLNKNMGDRLTYPHGIPLNAVGASATGVALSPGT